MDVVLLNSSLAGPEPMPSCYVAGGNEEGGVSVEQAIGEAVHQHAGEAMIHQPSTSPTTQLSARHTHIGSQSPTRPRVLLNQLSVSHGSQTTSPAIEGSRVETSFEIDCLCRSLQGVVLSTDLALSLASLG